MDKFDVVAAIITKNNKYFIAKRAKGKHLENMYEFPGGKLLANESHENGLKREIKEELGLRVRIGKKIMTHRHSYTRFRVTLNVFNCHIHSGVLSPSACDEWKWVNPKELDQFPFPAANLKIIGLLNKNSFEK